MDTTFKNKMLEFMERMEDRLTALEFSSKQSHGDFSPSSPRGKKDSNPMDRHPVTKATCSGRDQTAHDVVAHNIAWPHFYVTSTENRPAKYDSLTLDEFLFGYLCIHDNEPDPATQRAMFQHLRELMLDMKQHTWAEVRSFHALVLSKMEAGRATWLDLPGIEYIRAREGYLSPIPIENVTDSGQEWEDPWTQP